MKTFLNTHRYRIGLALLATLTSACGKDDDKTTGSGKGDFPSFYSLALEVVPSVEQSTTALAARSPFAAMTLLPMADSGALTSTFTTDTTKFSDAFSSSQNLIGQVLLDAGTSGPVKSMFVLLAGADATMEDINSNFSDADGNPSDCTAIAAGTTLSVPFFSGAGVTAAFNAFDAAGKYTCYVEQGSGGVLAFGRHAIADAPADCTTPYEWYVLVGSGEQGRANTEQVSERGSTVDGSGIANYYYNGCTKDLSLYYAQQTLYSAGVEFASRTELTGNTAESSFKIRSNFVDVASTYNMHNAFVGVGVSKKSDSSSATAVNFMMGYREQSCTAASPGVLTGCTTAADHEHTFCAKNAGTGSDYALADSSADCASYTTEYSALEALAEGDLPSAYFEVTPTTLGL